MSSLPPTAAAPPAPVAPPVAANGRAGSGALSAPDETAPPFRLALVSGQLGRHRPTICPFGITRKVLFRTFPNTKSHTLRALPAAAGPARVALAMVALRLVRARFLLFAPLFLLFFKRINPCFPVVYHKDL